ncbi:MAG: GntR family transcriptional regulator [Planctomycetes bacterium]|nr:GntR family transcriptional regulator [Planctomycetota bacterium]
MASPVVFRNIREQIANHLRQEVLSGRVRRGDPLREVELAERYGVSRSPVRDALLQLTQEGLLVAEPNCGVRVHGGPSETLRPLVISLRRQIERFALDLVFDELDEPALASWHSILDRLKWACDANDFAGVIEHDMAFHRWIIERTGDADLVAVWLPIVSRMLLVYSRHESLSEVYPEHLAVFNAVRAGDRAAALAALEANIV